MMNHFSLDAFRILSLGPEDLAVLCLGVNSSEFILPGVCGASRMCRPSSSIGLGMHAAVFLQMLFLSGPSFLLLGLRSAGCYSLTFIPFSPCSSDRIISIVFKLTDSFFFCSDALNSSSEFLISHFSVADLPFGSFL